MNNNNFSKSPFIKGDVRRTGGFAFTLFELLVSISIIGILVAVASTAYGVTQKKARDSRRIEDMNAVSKAAEVYYSQNNSSYPTATGDFTTSGTLQLWPVDPKAGASGTGWTGYEYTPDGTFSAFCACAATENPTGGNSSTNACAFTAAGGPFYCVKNQQ